ncbi:hypothetical protein [Pandoraea terrae]|nr:hypothetical protein [Pandoraea terrae]
MDENHDRQAPISCRTHHMDFISGIFSRFVTARKAIFRDDDS